MKAAALLKKRATIRAKKVFMLTIYQAQRMCERLLDVIMLSPEVMIARKVAIAFLYFLMSDTGNLLVDLNDVVG